jgi:hypothetical protein
MSKISLAITGERISLTRFFAFMLVAIQLLTIGCGHSDESKKMVTDPGNRYLATNKGDTAKASLEITDNYFRGVLEITYDNVKDSGNVKGMVKGDTLIGNFNFQHYGMQKWRIKPVAFLKKNGSLIMGEGKLKMTYGILYFNPLVPIRFDSTQLIFKRVN